MKFVTKFIIPILCLSLSACVSTRNVPLTSDHMALLKGHSFGMTRYPVPAFSAMTPAKAELGMIGAIAMVAEGNSRILENNVNDPAVTIASELAKSVSAKFAGRVVTSPHKTISDYSVSAISAEHKDTDYVIDVKTINWSCVYYPLNWGRYRVIYSAKFRLIDTRKQAVLCEGFYSRIPYDPDNAPSYTQLLEDNHAAKLKSELNIAKDGAVGQFKTDTLKL